MDFGIRNDGSFVKTIELPTLRATVTIAEGEGYDATLVSGGHVIGLGLAPGLGLCGVVTVSRSTSAVSLLRIQGQIPIETTPTSLSVAGYPPVDLTVTPKQGMCVPDTANLQAQSVALRASGNDATLQIKSISTATNYSKDSPYLQTILAADLQNRSRLSDFVVGDLALWLIDEDGIARAPYDQARGSAEEVLCDYAANPISLKVGPAHTRRDAGLFSSSGGP